MKRLGAPLAGIVALALAGCGGGGGGPSSSTTTTSTAVAPLVLGKGAGQVEVYRPPKGGARPPGVVFLHGWGATDPRFYGLWVQHLVAEGNEVIYPRYQRSVVSDPKTALGAAAVAIAAALRRAPVAPHSLVFAGHSAGGALSADLAVVAKKAGLPQPLAVFAVYPGRRLKGVEPHLPEQDPARIPASTWVTALGGADDQTVGTGPARELVRRAVRVPRAHRHYVLVRTPSIAIHRGPLSATVAARKAFWLRLDRLIADRRGAAG